MFPKSPDLWARVEDSEGDGTFFLATLIAAVNFFRRTASVSDYFAPREGYHHLILIEKPQVSEVFRVFLCSKD